MKRAGAIAAAVGALGLLWVYAVVILIVVVLFVAGCVELIIEAVS